MSPPPGLPLHPLARMIAAVAVLIAGLLFQAVTHDTRTFVWLMAVAIVATLTQNVVRAVAASAERSSEAGDAQRQVQATGPEPAGRVGGPRQDLRHPVVGQARRPAEDKQVA
jgi:hypothetical protein